MLKIYLPEKVSWKVMTKQMGCQTKKDVQDLHHDTPDRLHLTKAGTAHPQALVLALAAERLLVNQDDIDHQIAIDHALVRALDLTLAHRLHDIEVERIGTVLLQALALDLVLVLLNGQEGIIHPPARVPEDDR